MLNILKASLFYNLLDVCLVKITESVKNSALYRVLRFLLLKFLVYLTGSLIVGLIVRLSQLIDREIKASFLRQRFLYLEEGAERARSSVVYKAYARIMGGFGKLFSLLGLGRLFEGSIFTKPFLWCALAVVAFPLLTTMTALPLVLAGFATLFLSMMSKKDFELRYFSINKYIYLYVLVYILATMFAMGRGGNITITALICTFMLFAIVLMNAITTREALRGLITAMVIMGGVVALIGLYRHFFVADIPPEAWVDQYMFDIERRAYSTFENPNVLGTYFLLLIPFALGRFVMEKERVLRLFFAGVLFLMAVVLILTFSRGAYLGVLISVALFLVMMNKRLIAPGIFALIVVALLAPEAVVGRFLSIGDLTDTSTAYRISIWMGTLAMMREYWALGIGPGLDAWSLIYPTYAYSAVVAQHSHNLFLQTLAELGVIGFTVFLLVLYHFFKNVCQSYSVAKGEQRIYAIASISAVLGFLVMGVGDYALYNFRLRLFFWIVLAIGLANRALPNSEVKE